MGLAGGAGPPAPRRGGKPGEEADREKNEGKQLAWICLLGTGAAYGDRRGERGRSHRALTSPPGQRRPAGWITAPAPSSWAPASSLRFWCIWAPGAPRCGPERRNPHRREQEQPGTEWPVRPAERACVRGQRAASAPGFCLASRLNFPRRD